MRLRNILLCSYVFMALLTAVVGGIGIQATRTLHDEFEFVRNDLLPVSDALEDLRLAGITIASSAAEYGLVSSLGLPPADGFALSRKKLTDATASFIETLIRYERMVMAHFPEEEGYLAEVRLQGGQLQGASLNLMDLLRTGQNGEPLLHGYQALQQRQGEFIQAINNAIDHEKEELTESKEKTHAILETGRSLGVTVVVTVFALALLVGVLLSGWLSRPLVRLKAAAEAFGRGDLTLRVDSHQGGEIGALTRAFNLMAASLQAYSERIVAGEKHLNRIIQSVPDGLLVTDGQDRVVLMNQAAERLLDIPFSEAQHQPLSSLLKDECKKVQNGCLADSDGRVELALSNRDTGAVRTILLALSAMDQDGGGNIVVLRDITGERQIARMKTQFIATAAHELSTPLTSIMGYANLLYDEAAYGDFSSEQKRAFIVEVHDNAEYLHELTEKLLDLDRMESGRAIPLSLREGSLRDAIVKVVNRYRRLYPDHAIELEVAEAAEGLSRFDPLRLNQVLENLVSNAVKYSSPGSRILLTLAPVAGGWQVSVEDAGIGMTAEEQALVFDPFYRVNDSDTAPRGTGLGLCIVKNIIENHGGRIWIDSVPGRGSQVRFVLPQDAPAA